MKTKRPRGGVFARRIPRSSSLVTYYSFVVYGILVGAPGKPEESVGLTFEPWKSLSDTRLSRQGVFQTVSNQQELPKMRTLPEALVALGCLLTLHIVLIVLRRLGKSPSQTSWSWPCQSLDSLDSLDILSSLAKSSQRAQGTSPERCHDLGIPQLSPLAAIVCFLRQSRFLRVAFRLVLI